MKTMTMMKRQKETKRERERERLRDQRAQSETNDWCQAPFTQQCFKNKKYKKIT